MCESRSCGGDEAGPSQSLGWAYLLDSLCRVEQRDAQSGARDAAEEEVVANARQIASTMTPFYGEATTKELFSLLDINYGAVKEYSEATVAGNKRRQDAALTRLASNAKDLAYGEIRCVGKKDECVGEYTFLWGRGGFKGITGTTPFIGGIYIEQQKEGQLYGTAHWAEMTYSLP